MKGETESTLLLAHLRLGLLSDSSNSTVLLSLPVPMVLRVTL
jgi:hypothetical protein